MKNLAVLSAVALLATAGSAHGQAAAAAATLNLRIVPQVGAPGAPNVTDLAGNTHNQVGAADANRTRRFEIQYQIVDASGLVAGLSSLQFNILAAVSGGSVGFAMDRALLSRNESGSPGGAGLSDITVPPASVDSSVAAANGARGLHRPFRGGIPAPAPNNTNAANGIVALNQQGIGLVTPLALSQPNQFGGPDAASAGWFGLYSFEVTVGSSASGTDPDNDGFATINILATAVADSQTGNRWGGFEDADPVPHTSRNAGDGTASFRVEIPAPGSLALVGLGGLVAARRRRA